VSAPTGVTAINVTDANNVIFNVAVPDTAAISVAVNALTLAAVSDAETEAPA
jgi:hypothetical protein